MPSLLRRFFVIVVLFVDANSNFLHGMSLALGHLQELFLALSEELLKLVLGLVRLDGHVLVLAVLSKGDLRFARPFQRFYKRVVFVGDSPVQVALEQGLFDRLHGEGVG